MLFIVEGFESMWVNKFSALTLQEHISLKEILVLLVLLLVLKSFRNPLQNGVCSRSARLLLSRHADDCVLTTKNYYPLISESNLVVLASCRPQTGDFRQQTHRWSG